MVKLTQVIFGDLVSAAKKKNSSSRTWWLKCVVRCKAGQTGVLRSGLAVFLFLIYLFYCFLMNATLLPWQACSSSFNWRTCHTPTLQLQGRGRDFPFCFVPVSIYIIHEHTPPPKKKITKNKNQLTWISEAYQLLPPDLCICVFITLIWFRRLQREHDSLLVGAQYLHKVTSEWLCLLF